MQNAIKNAISIEQVVDAINSAETVYFGGTDLRQSDVQAAEYAADATLETEQVYIDDIEAHLELISRAGAKFNLKRALSLSKKMVCKALIIKAADDGVIKVRSGVRLFTSKEIRAEQRDWHEMDTSKHKDFTKARYWLMAGKELLPIDDDGDLLEALL